MNTEGQITPQNTVETANPKLFGTVAWFPVTVVLLVVLVIVGLFIISNPSKTGTSTTKDIVASVNGKDISKKDFDAVVKVSTDQKQTILDRLIEAEILNQYLLAKNVKTSDTQIRGQILYDSNIDANEFLNGRVRLLSKKITTINGFTTDQEFADWYTKEKAKAKIEIIIKL